MPEIIVETNINGQTTRTVYRDVRVSSVAGGVVGELVAASATGEASDPKAGKTTFQIGRTAIEGLDMPLVARVVTGSSPDPASMPMSPVMRVLAYQDYRMTTAMGEVTIGRLVSRDFRARPGREPLNQAIRGLMETAERQQAQGGRNRAANPQDMVLVGQFFSIFDNFEYGVMDVEAMQARFGQGADGGGMTIAAMRFSDKADSPGLAIRDMVVQGGPARFALAEFEARDFGFRDTFRAAAELLQSGNPSALERNWQRLIPKLGTLRMRGLDLTAPDESGGARQQAPRTPQTIRITAKAMELGFGGQLNGVPTALRFGAEELQVPVPASSTDENARQLRAMGIERLNLDWLADLAWRQQGQTLDIAALNVAARDLFAFGLSGRLGNISPEAFSTDAALAQVAWLQATAQQLKLSLRNGGLVEKIIENEARKARRSVDQLRREWGTLAAMGLPAILGDSEGARAISQAVSRFLARPGELEIEATSRAPGGVGLPDAIAVMGNPRAIFDRIEVKAAAR